MRKVFGEDDSVACEYTDEPRHGIDCEHVSFHKCLRDTKQARVVVASIKQKLNMTQSPELAQHKLYVGTPEQCGLQSYPDRM